MPQLSGFSAHPLLVAIMLLPVLTFGLTYAISLSMGLMQYPFYFLSVSIESKPASCFGSFGLSITCLLAPFMAFIRSQYVLKVARDTAGCDKAVKDRTMTERALLWNDRALKIACVTGLGGHGVASFQSKSEDASCGDAKWIVGVHLLFAGAFFGGGLLYCLVTHYIDVLMPGLGTVRERLARKVFAYGTVAQFVTLMFILPAIFMAQGGAETDDDGGLDCERGGCELIAFMSVFEVTLLVTFLSTYVTFLGEFKSMKLTLTVLHDDRGT